MAIPMGTAQPKPKKGTVWLEGRQRRAERKAHEDREMTAARKRDMALTHGCRWARCEHMPHKPRLEVSHCFQHRGMGGDPSGERTERRLLMLACFIHHSRIDDGDLEVRAQDDELGTDGPLDFYARNEFGRMELVASETRIGVSVMRGR